jgi:predicted  nucleic acid-binding Zn-ribbon protein
MSNESAGLASQISTARAYRQWMTAQSDEDAINIRSSFHNEVMARVNHEETKWAEIITSQSAAKSILERDIDQLRAGCNVVGAHQRLTVKQASLTEAQERLKAMVEYRNDKLAKAEVKSKESLITIQQQLMARTDEIASLKATIAAQTCTKEQALELAHRHQDLRTKVEAQTKQRALLRDRLFTCESNVTKLSIDIEGKVTSYNDSIPAAMIPPLPSNIMNDMNNGSNNSSMITDDDAIDLHIQRERSALSTNVSALKSDANESGREVADCEERTIEQEKRCQLREGQIQQKKLAIKEITDKANNELNGMEAEVQQEEATIRELSFHAVGPSPIPTLSVPALMAVCLVYL